MARVDVAIVERRANYEVIGSRAGGLHSRTIEVLGQRGIADGFLEIRQAAQVAGFAQIKTLCATSSLSSLPWTSRADGSPR